MKSFLTALKFLTVLPFGKKLEFQEKELAKSTGYFPLVGVLIGLLLVAVDFILSPFFSNSIVNLFILITLIVITGALHLDGFMDAVDGLFGGQDQDEKLRIMKDTQTGSFGIVALIVLLLLKFTLISELSGERIFPLILILMPALGRWSMVSAMPFYPYPRKKGTGSFTKFVEKKDVLIATVIMFVLTIGLLRLEGLILLFGTFIFMVLITQLISRKIGGMTGDTYGALNEVIEVVILISAYGLNKIWLI